MIAPTIWANCLTCRPAVIFIPRLQNPTCDTVAAKITELEGGTAGMLTGSGQAANFFALFNICNAGDHIVSSGSIYGGTFNLDLRHHGKDGHYRHLCLA